MDGEDVAGGGEDEYKGVETDYVEEWVAEVGSDDTYDNIAISKFTKENGSGQRDFLGS